MVKINRIYTRTGDKGKTRLVGGSEVDKNSERIECLGEIDELNACLGIIRTFAKQESLKELEQQLELIQNELFDLGSEVATPAAAEYPGMLKTCDAQVTRLENWIDQVTGNIPELKSFVLPGGTNINAFLHLARTVCRRAERHIVTLSKKESIQPPVISYLNRLSDLLFAMARAESYRSKTPEFLWIPGKDRH